MEMKEAYSKQKAQHEERRNWGTAWRVQGTVRTAWLEQRFPQRQHQRLGAFQKLVEVIDQAPGISRARYSEIQIKQNANVALSKFAISEKEKELLSLITFSDS